MKMSEQSCNFLFFLDDLVSTDTLGAAMAATIFPSLVIMLEGDLGVGKTTLVKSICRHLGWEGAKSPSFALVNEYPQGKLPVAHADLYRLERVDGAEMGFDDYLDSGWVLMIEWPHRLIFEDFPELWYCQLSLVKGKRQISVKARGISAQRALEVLKERCRAS